MARTRTKIRSIVPIYELPEWTDAKLRFSKNRPALDFDGPIDPQDREMLALVERIDAWLDFTSRRLGDIRGRVLSQRFSRIAEAVGRGLRLKQELDTARTSKWLESADANPGLRTIFITSRKYMNERLSDLADIGSRAMIDADLRLPSEDGSVRSLLSNTFRTAAVLGGRRFGPIQFGLAGTVVGAVLSAWRERTLIKSGVGLQLRSVPILAVPNDVRVDRINKLADSKLLHQSRGELLRSVYESLEVVGVVGDAADATIVKVLRLAESETGRAWKGLVTVRELINHAGLDPQQADFIEAVSQNMTDDVAYTHCPGREWIVREYEIGRALLTVDSKVSRTEDSIVLSQTGASIAPGAVANNHALMKIAAHYMKPVKIYSNAIVAQTGDDHRRHRNVYRDFFRKGKVLERSAFIERTVEELVDSVEKIARSQGGRFDFKNDLAFKFPIRIICDFLGVPVKDAPYVQAWTEDLVRALDAGAGLSYGVLRQGNESAAAFFEYLSEMIERARSGQEVDGIIGQVACTDQQSDDELLANLVTLAFAGFETTTGLLTMGFHELLQRREQWDYLRSALTSGPAVAVGQAPAGVVPDRDLRWYLWARDERRGRLGNDSDNARFEELGGLLEVSSELAERLEQVRHQEAALTNAIEEMLRWTTPGSVIPLTLEHDYELKSPVDARVKGSEVCEGESLKFSKGETVVVDLAQANRNGCPFGVGRFEATSGDFDISRSENTKHLSFGVSHICIGADLAVENAKRMTEAVLRRFPNLVLEGPPDESDGQLFMALTSLPVTTGDHRSPAEIDGPDSRR